MIFPDTFLNRIQLSLGKDFEPFIKALTLPAPVSIRSNADKITVQASLKPIPWTSTGYYLPERPVFTLDPLLHAGAYYVQEASSMFLEQAFKTAISTDEPLAVLDLCAAPGGKTTHLASLIKKTDLLVANEVIKSRASILRENVIKWGSGNVMVTNNDPDDFTELQQVFDVIVVDAPCSGEGMFRKDPSAVKEWSEATVNFCSERQQRILMQIHTALKPGGCLIYSTCTYNESENEHNIVQLQKLADFETVRILVNPDWGIEEVLHKDTYGYRFYPHKLQGEGLFMAVLRKTGNDKHLSIPKIRKPVLASLPNKEKEPVEQWIDIDVAHQFFKNNETVWLWPFYNHLLAEYIYSRLRVVYAGVETLELKGKDYIPSQALANSGFLHINAAARIALSHSDALKYLSKADIHLNNIDKGYCVLTYKGIPLGWLKHLGNRSNNLYPKEWHIRMNISNAQAPVVLF